MKSVINGGRDMQDRQLAADKVRAAVARRSARRSASRMHVTRFFFPAPTRYTDGTEEATNHG